MIQRIDSLLQKLPLLDVFSLKKTIGSSLLNKLGIQPLRIKMADIRYGMRKSKVSNELADAIHDLDNNGFAVISNFLSDAEFIELEKECLTALEDIPKTVIRQDGPNQYTNIAPSALNDFPAIQSMFSNSKVENLFNAAERRTFKLSKITRLLSCLIQGDDNGKDDPETFLHEDTFHNTFKAWLYITDVDYPQAPLVYVKGSHNHALTDRFNKVREYSQRKDAVKSRRISTEELNELGLEETHMLVKKNTLIIANTLGFHRRLRGEAGNKRIAIAFSARFNPFL